MIDKTTRLNPYKLLAYRTIGLDRDNAQKIGLEQTYDSLLKGRSGRRLVRYIAGGASIPIEDYEIEPETGKDIVTTLDVFIQEVTENALMKMMVSNEATSGCAIVMETKTGKIKAIANLGRTESGNYTENFNYAINPSEPGSTFKLVTMISLLEDKKINLNSIVNLQGGIWEINGKTVKDSEQHGRNEVTAKQAFELSSNVGMAKMAYTNYASNPYQFINHIHNLRMDTLTGIDITGERKPVIHMPGTKLWSAISIPWMSFGYGIAISPLQTLVLYNAVANNGKMMKPYLLNAVKDEGAVIKEFTPTVINEKICSDNTLQQLKTCLEGVCTDGTAKYLFKNSQYKVAGKTGTAKVSDGSSTYEDKIYQSSFAGFFPADNPQYTIVVVIKNKAHAAKVYGSEVAGPVFKEISDRLYVSFVKKYDNQLKQIQRDSSIISYVGNKNDLQQVTRKLNINLGNIDARGDELIDLATNGSSIKVNKRVVAVSSSMPQLKGMGLKDAIATCENLGLKVTVKGKGKVSNQSINVGQYISKGQMINIELNP
jgi:cell division protein FtsI (penicillin-binding protein 3)